MIGVAFMMSRVMVGVCQLGNVRKELARIKKQEGLGLSLCFINVEYIVGKDKQPSDEDF